MNKEILAEDFVNASNAYSEFQDALGELFKNDQIMLCLIGNLNKLADEYYKSIMHIHSNGMTLDEALKLHEKGDVVV